MGSHRRENRLLRLDFIIRLWDVEAQVLIERSSQVVGGKVSEAMGKITRVEGRGRE